MTLCVCVFASGNAICLTRSQANPHGALGHSGPHALSPALAEVDAVAAPDPALLQLAVAVQALKRKHVAFNPHHVVRDVSVCVVLCKA